LPQWKKDSNLTFTVLFLQIVTALSTLQQSSKHSPIFWIQLDNTLCENKYKYLLTYCSWLIYLGWFKKIVISFLSAGHTHVDIDQMFLTLFIWLLSNSVSFIMNLVSSLSTAYKQESTVPSRSFLPTVFNWKDFFALHA
jgi:hypothetical protein